MSATSTRRSVVDAHRPVKRRFAPNVICLSTFDLLPVENPRWRGRLPRNVIRITLMPRLKVGDLAEICGAALKSNHGKMVIIEGPATQSDLPPGDWYAITAVDALLDHASASSRDRCGTASAKAVTLGGNLRRVSRALLSLWRQS